MAEVVVVPIVSPTRRQIVLLPMVADPLRQVDVQWLLSVVLVPICLDVEGQGWNLDARRVGGNVDTACLVDELNVST